MSGDGKGCGLFCPSEVERARPRPSVYEFGDLRWVVSDTGAEVEIVSMSKRLSTRLVGIDVELLYRMMLEEYSSLLFGDGDDGPRLTALYTLKAVYDASIQWLRTVSRKRAELRQRIGELEKRLAGVKAELERAEKELENCSDQRCRDTVWAKYNVNGLSYVENNIERDLEKLRRELEDVERIEQRIALAALALSHAWQALTMPDIEHLVKFYDYSRKIEDRNTLWSYFLDKKEAKAEAEG